MRLWYEKRNTPKAWCLPAAFFFCNLKDAFAICSWLRVDVSLRKHYAPQQPAGSPRLGFLVLLCDTEDEENSSTEDISELTEHFAKTCKKNGDTVRRFLHELLDLDTIPSQAFLESVLLP
jgi:hypothetical protein